MHRDRVVLGLDQRQRVADESRGAASAFDRTPANGALRLFTTVAATRAMGRDRHSPSRSSRPKADGPISRRRQAPCSRSFPWRPNLQDHAGRARAQQKSCTARSLPFGLCRSTSMHARRQMPAPWLGHTGRPTRSIGLKHAQARPPELSDIRPPNWPEPGRTLAKLGGNIRQPNSANPALARPAARCGGGTVNPYVPGSSPGRGAKNERKSTCCVRMRPICSPDKYQTAV